MPPSLTEPHPPQACGETRDAPRRARPEARATRVSIALVASALLLLTLFPGDTQLRGDELNLLDNAARANIDGRLATHGLVGSTGVLYGPIPTQFYQVLLWITSDIRGLVLIRAAVFGVVMAGALWSLGTTLRLPRGFIPVLLVAPWTWYYVRTPWDNTFVLPLGCLLLAGYARWLVKPTRVSVGVWTAAAVAMPLVHLSAAALPLVVGLHAVAFHAPALRRTFVGAIVGLVLASASSVPYLVDLPRSLAAAAGDTAHLNLVERLEIFGYALRAPTILGAEQTYYSIPETSVLREPLTLLGRIGQATWVWMLAGVIAAAMSVRRGASGPRVPLATVAIASIAALGLVLAVARVNWQPHYLVGVFAPTALLCWMGTDLLSSNRLGRWALVTAPSIAIVGVTVGVFLEIHRNGGGAGWFGHSAGELAEILDHMEQQAVREILTDSGELYLRRDDLARLRWIDSHGRIPESSSGAALVVRLRKAHPSDHALVVDSIMPDDPDALFRVYAWPDDSSRHVVTGQ